MLDLWGALQIFGLAAIIVFFLSYSIPSKKTFNITLNSGYLIPILIENKEIADEMIMILEACFNDTIGDQFIEMNIEKAQIKGADNIIIDKSKKNIDNSVHLTIEYNKLSEELEVIIQSLLKNTNNAILPEDLSILKEIQVDSKNKDGVAIESKLKKLSKSALPALVEFSKSLGVGVLSNIISHYLGI